MPRFPRFLMILGTEGKARITEGKPKGLTAAVNNLVKRNRFFPVNAASVTTPLGT